MKVNQTHYSSDEILALIFSLSKNQDKEAKEGQKALISLLKESEYSYKDDRDKEYVKVDEDLKESSKNFFKDKTFDYLV